MSSLRRTQFWLAQPAATPLPAWPEVSGVLHANLLHPVSGVLSTHALVQLSRRMTQAAIRRRLYTTVYDSVVMLPASKQARAVRNFLRAHPAAQGLDTVRLQVHAECPATDDYLARFLAGQADPPRLPGAAAVLPNGQCSVCHWEPCMRGCLAPAAPAAAAMVVAVAGPSAAQVLARAAADAEDAEDSEDDHPAKRQRS